MKTIILLLIVVVSLNAQSVNYTANKNTKTGTIDISPILQLGMSWSPQVNVDSIYQSGYQAGFIAGQKSMLDSLTIQIQGKMKFVIKDSKTMFIIDTLHVP